MDKCLIITCIAIAVLTLCIVLIIIYYQNKIKRFSESFSNILDLMIAERQVDFNISNETLLSKLSYKLKRLYEILNEKNKRINVEKENIQSLIADISHQVKTPVANIKMYNSILSERDMPPEKQKEFLKLSDGQIDKLEFLMNSLIKMSRLENGVIQLTTNKNSVKALIAKAVSQILIKADKKDISLEVECDDDLFAMFDDKWTEEAIFNILDNAVKYTKECGRIVVNVELIDMYVAIHIIDNGIGISEEEQSKIFKRFFRSASVHNVEGIGVGLFLAREIISKENGFIKVSSEIKKGSDFCIYLMR